MLDRFLRLYKQNGVLDDSGQKLKELLLHEACPDAAECWAGSETSGRLANWNKIQLPFIGPLYANSRSRLAVLGINLNGDGGLFSLHWLVANVQSIFTTGIKKTHFGVEGYSGTLFWHRLAAYSLLAVRSDWNLSEGEVWLGESRLLDNLEALSDVLNSIAFLELIKCSPAWERSSPTGPMWSQCPRRFLISELRILAPRTILVLGKETLTALPMETGSPVAEAENSLIRLYHSTIEGGEVSLINVVHPTWPGGGSAESLVSDLARLLRSNEDWQKTVVN